MFRTLFLIATLLLAVSFPSPPASALGPSYPLYCSGGVFSKAAATPAYPFVYAFHSSLNNLDDPTSVCGWPSRAWRSGEPTQLCMSESEHATFLGVMRNLGQFNANGEFVTGRFLEFEVANDFKGCMVVTDFHSTAGFGAATTALTCRNFYGQASIAGYAGFFDADVLAQTSRPVPGETQPRRTCYRSGGAAGYYPNGNALCQSVPAQSGNEFLVLTVVPWWPCAIVTSIVATPAPIPLKPGFVPQGLYTLAPLVKPK